MKAVILARVSTTMQSESGVSLQEQVESSMAFCKSTGREVVATFKEVGSGAARSRPVLNEALALCKKTGAALVVKSLSRLSRRVALIASLMEEGVQFVVVEMGTVLCPFQTHVLAAFAEMERRRISERVRAGMKQAKKNGVRFGNPNIEVAAASGRRTQSEEARKFTRETMAVIEEIKAAGVKTKTGIAKALNARGVKTRRGKMFSCASVLHIIRQSQRFQTA